MSTMFLHDRGVPEFMESLLTDLPLIWLLAHISWYSWQVEEGKLKVSTGDVFKLDEIVKVHQTVDENKAGGQIVVP